jgi:hypothetical protein
MLGVCHLPTDLGVSCCCILQCDAADPLPARFDDVFAPAAAAAAASLVCQQPSKTNQNTNQPMLHLHPLQCCTQAAAAHQHLLHVCLLTFSPATLS